MNTAIEKLLFGYDADSGKVNALLYIGHKILRPDTCNCRLCQRAHGVFTERKAWERFGEETGLQLEFLHRDEYAKQYASKLGHAYASWPQCRENCNCLCPLMILKNWI